MARLGGQVQDRGDISAIDQVEKTDQFIPKIGTDEITSTLEFAVELLRFVETSSIISVVGPLPQWRLVVYSPDSLDYIIIEIPDLDCHAALLGSADVFSGFLREALPPLLESNQVNCGNTLPLHRIRVNWLGCREFLRKRKNVGP